DDEEIDDEFVHGNKQVKDDEDEEMTNVEDVDTGNGNDEITDASLFVLTVLVSMISEPFFLTPIPETPSLAHAITNLPPPPGSTISHVLIQSTTPISTPPIITEALSVTTILDPLHAIFQRVSVLEKDIQELKEAVNTTTLRASLKSEIPLAVMHFLDLVWEMHFKSTVKNALKKTPLPIAQSSSQAPSSLKVVESLSEYVITRKFQVNILIHTYF
nr:hypothetical protein [Tanacetum cinerariifolium]